MILNIFEIVISELDRWIICIIKFQFLAISFYLMKDSWHFLTVSRRSEIVIWRQTTTTTKTKSKKRIFSLFFLEFFFLFNPRIFLFSPNRWWQKQKATHANFTYINAQMNVGVWIDCIHGFETLDVPSLTHINILCSFSLSLVFHLSSRKPVARIPALLSLLLLLTLYGSLARESHYVFSLIENINERSFLISSSTSSLS